MTSRRTISALVLLALIGMLLAYPTGLLLVDLAPDTQPQWRQLVRDPLLQATVFRSLALAIAAIVIGTLLAMPCAWAVSRSSRATRRLLQLAAVLPLAIPPFVVAHHAAKLLESGSLDPLLAFSPGTDHRYAILCVVYAVHFFPILLLAITIGLGRTDRAAIDTARSFAVGGLRRLWHIVLPQLAPAYLFGVAIVMLRIVEDIGAPLLIGVNDLLAPQLLMALRTGGGDMDSLPQTVLALFALALLITLLAWPALSPRPRACALPPAGSSTASIPGATLPRLFVLLLTAAVMMSPVLALFAEWLVVQPATAPLTPALVAASYQAALPHTLIVAAGSGLLLGAVAVLVALLNRARGLAAGLGRIAIVASLAVPGPLLALAYRQLADFTPAWWPATLPIAWVFLGLVVAVKSLPYVQRILLWWPIPAQDQQLAIARGHGIHPASLSARTVFPVFFLLLVWVTSLGFAATVWESSAAMVLIETDTMPLAMLTFENLRRSADPAFSTTAGLVLIGPVFIALLLATLMLNRHRDRRPAGIARENYE